MADLQDETLAIALFRQARLLKLLNEVTKADLILYEELGETPETETAFEQLHNARERLSDSYSRVSNLLRRVCESQPEAEAALLDLFYQSIEQALATANAIEATVKETKRDWNLP